MLTLKFSTIFNSSTNVQATVAVPNYVVYTHTSGIKTVTVYPGLTQTNGVDYIVCSEKVAQALEASPDFAEKQYYHTCYVTNIEGKTIDVINN